MTCARTTLLLLLPVGLCGVAPGATVGPGHPAAVAQEGARQQASTQPEVQRSTAVLLLQNPAAAGRPGGFDIRTVGEIMTSTAFVDGAVKAALGLEARQWPRVVQIELAPAGEQSLKVIVTVRREAGSDLPAQPSAALLDEIVKRAQQEVERVAGNERPRLEQQIVQLKQQRDELAVRRQRLQEQVDDLRNHPSLSRSPQDGAAAQRQQIQEQLQRNRLRLQALEAMLPRIEELYRGMNSPLDELVELHRRKVGILEQQVAEGAASPMQLIDAQIALAEARSRRSGTGADANGRSSSLLRYYNEVISLRVEVGVAEAQLALLGGPATAPAAAALTREEASRQLNDLSQQLSDVQRQHAEAGAQLENAQRRLDTLGPAPRLVVLDGARDDR